MIKKRSFCDKYIYSFNNRLRNESWDFVYETDSIQLAFTRFQGVIDQHFEYNFKMQSFIINYKNRHPWMTQALRTQIIRKNEIHTIALATKDKTKFDDHNKVKNLLKSSLRNAEILYYSNQFDLHKNDLAKSWKLLKTIIGKDL